MKKFFSNVRNDGTKRILLSICVLLCSLSSLFAQSKSVKGQVTDVTGEPMIGVNVLEIGTSNGVITDLDGNFTLQVSPSATLRFTYIGYLAQEIEVKNQTSLNVQW